jgi:hypothetical protein
MYQTAVQNWEIDTMNIIILLDFIHRPSFKKNKHFGSFFCCRLQVTVGWTEPKIKTSSTYWPPEDGGSTNFWNVVTLIKKRLDNELSSTE